MNRPACCQKEVRIEFFFLKLDHSSLYLFGLSTLFLLNTAPQSLKFNVTNDKTAK